MRTLTVIAEQLLAPVPGGTGRYAGQITSALAATAPPGWRVRSVTAWHQDVEAAVLPGVGRPRRLPVPPKVLSEIWRHGLPPWPAGESVHATTPLAPGRRSVGHPLGRPLVVTVHDTVPWTHPATLTPRGVAWHQDMIARAARWASAVVVPTQAVAEELADIHPSLTRRISVVGHGVTSLPLPADANERKTALGLPARYVLSLATVEPRKGLDVLVKAMRDVGEADLVVVGQRGWGDVDLATWADASGLAPTRVLALGRITDDDLAVVLRHAAVLAVPSRAEGFGLPVLEGLAAGVPVVCSDIPALAEVAGGAAALVPVGDAGALAEVINQILADTTLTATMQGRGVERAGRYRWDTAALQLWDLHRSLR
jgi:glycosyltransferase involved in cell wall biosynthesis